MAMRAHVLVMRVRLHAAMRVRVRLCRLRRGCTLVVDQYLLVVIS